MYPFTPAGCNFWSDLNSPPSSTGASARTAKKGMCPACPYMCVCPSICPSWPTRMELIRAFLSFAWCFGAHVFNNHQIHLLRFESTREKLGEAEATKAYPCGCACLFRLEAQKQTDQITMGFFCPSCIAALLSKLLPWTACLCPVHQVQHRLPEMLNLL